MRLDDRVINPQDLPRSFFMQKPACEIKECDWSSDVCSSDLFNEWTQKSLSKLAEMVPGRYAKSEMSSGFIGAIDRYVYRSPLAQAASQTASNAGTTPSNRSATPGNTGTTSSTPDQTTQPTPGNTGTTPSKPEQTTHPAPM